MTEERNIMKVRGKDGTMINVPDEEAKEFQNNVGRAIRIATAVLSLRTLRMHHIENNDLYLTPEDVMIEMFTPIAMNRMGSFRNQIQFIRDYLWYAATGQQRVPGEDPDLKCLNENNLCMDIACLDFSEFEKAHNLESGEVLDRFLDDYEWLSMVRKQKRKNVDESAGVS